MIETAESYFQGPMAQRRPIIRRRLRDRHLTLNIEESNKTLRAEINHSRWLVSCPHCYNAELLFEDKKFLCSECKNEMIDGKLYKVTIPKDKLKIETLLEPRRISNRNWKHPETIDDLAKENKLHIKELK